jgi:hypothetical protein
MNPSSKWSSKFLLKNNTWVFVPTEEMIQYGKDVNHLLRKHWKTPCFYYHLKSGGHISALHQHLDNQYFVHLDIKEFFSQISRNRITRNIKSITGYRKAIEIADLSTVRSIGTKSILPFGFVQSPIIASICLDKSRLGTELRRLSQNSNYKVSVYMDDIIISSNDLVSLKEETELAFNKEKQEGPDKQITAFNIELSHKKTILTQARFDSFTEAIVATENPFERGGILKYVSTVNKDQTYALSAL